jgi:hypothetical protein
VLVGSRFDRRHRTCARHVKLGAAQDNTSSLCGRKGLTGASGDEGALFFCKGGEQVQDERVHIRPKLRDEERQDEMNIAAKTIKSITAQPPQAGSDSCTKRSAPIASLG